MRIVPRLLVLSTLTLVAVPVVPLTASAESASEAASTGAYFWQGKLPSTFTLGGQTQPNPANGQDTDADGVAREDLAVAVTQPGQSDKESFLLWDLLELTENDTITKFVVTLPLTEKGPSQDSAQNTFAYGGTPDLDICASQGGFGPTDAGAYEVKPEVDGKKCVPAKHDPAKKAYVADITTLASSWLTEANNGVAVVPADTSTAFQVVFQPADKHTAAIEFTKGEDPFAEVPFEEAPLTVDEGVSSDGGFDAGGADLGGSFDSGLSSGSAESPIVDTALPAEPVVEGGPAPDVAPAATQPVALQSVPGAPPLGFWLLALLLGGLLLLVSMVTGAGPVPPAARRAGRVLAQVQQNAAGRGAA